MFYYDLRRCRMAPTAQMEIVHTGSLGVHFAALSVAGPPSRPHANHPKDIRRDEDPPFETQRRRLAEAES